MLQRVEVMVEADRAVIITCRMSRNAGASAALALADRVTALLVARSGDRACLGTPMVEFDGRGTGGIRTVVTVPILAAPVLARSNRRDAG